MVTVLLDDLLFENLGIHFLEPRVHFVTKVKVKPSFAKMMKPEQAEALNYMKTLDKTRSVSPNLRFTKNIGGLDTIGMKTSIDKKLAIIEKKKFEDDKKKANEKRLLAMENKPKLNLALKMQVVKQDLGNRPFYQEVAEVLEEMLLAVEKGEQKLNKRGNRIPG